MTGRSTWAKSFFIIFIGLMAVSFVMWLLKQGGPASLNSAEATAPIDTQSSNTIPANLNPDSTRTLDSSRNPVVAVVNDTTITTQEWEQAFALDRVMSTFSGMPPPEAEAVLARLINLHLVLNAAASNSSKPTASEEQAEERLQLLLQQWGVEQADLEPALVGTELTRQQFIEELQKLLQAEAYLFQISQTQDSATWLEEQRQKAHISVYTGIQESIPLAVTATGGALPTAPSPAQVVTSASEDRAPYFELLTTNGELIQLNDSQGSSSLAGKPVVLHFWASWCAACRNELQALETSYQRYKESGVVLLGVNLREEADAVSQFAAANGMTYPLLLDSRGEVSAQYQIIGIPTTIFIDAQGSVRSRHVGPLEEETFDREVQTILPQAEQANPESGSMKAPDINLPREDGSLVKLDDFLDQRSVVIVFYRGKT